MSKRKINWRYYYDFHDIRPMLFHYWVLTGAILIALYLQRFI